MLTDSQVAMVCHEANRAYCACLGDLGQPSWNLAPDWQKQSAISGVRFHLESLRGGRFPSPSESHEVWLKHKAAEGWKYGPIKDPDKKEHPCFLPYDQLPLDQRMKDYLFAAIVHSFYIGERASARPADDSAIAAT